MLGYKGYIYTVERQNQEKIVFRCKNRQCKGKLKQKRISINFSHWLGRCHTDPNMNTILSEPTERCHGPTIDQIPVIELKDRIKSRVLTSEEPTSNILYSEIKSFPLDAAGQVPQTDTLQRTIRRQRQTPKSQCRQSITWPFKTHKPWREFYFSWKRQLDYFYYHFEFINIEKMQALVRGWNIQSEKEIILLLLNHIWRYFRYVRMISINCLHYTHRLNHKLFHWYMGCL